MPTKILFERIDSIELQGVSKKYGSRFAVESLDLTIEGGELLILIGPSGSGKTTTLRMINRMIEPDSGSILINGQNVMHLDPVRLRRNMGYVIQNIGLFPHMTIEENVGLVPKLEGWDQNRTTERVRYLLDFVSLPPDRFINRYPRQLSGGQQQRVGLARALAMDPPLLLMDEPFGALDPILRKQLQKEFLEIKKEIGRTIVFVTHDIEEAFRLGDRIAVMDNARLLQVGAPEDLIFEPVNELVADIVDTARKFKHMDTLNVKDLMTPLDTKYILEGDLDACHAVEVMKDRNTETCIVLDNGKLIGKLEMVNLLKCEEKNPLVRDIAKPMKVFALRDSVATALSEMKRSGEYMAMVMNGDTICGMLVSDEVLLKLI
ncbi:MAG: betaine/proline/choline family ABC transporter ATP-binding protein [Methanomethylovorans sp.]|jgi:osmoprotectant transport system ATP-binding protein|nr:betaine/proline/choline family ABC transporter ATP-binding protein [Methanomethylovorans sp.]